MLRFVYYFDIRVLLCCRWEFFVVVLLGMNVFLNAELMLMMAQSRAEGTRDTYNYGQYLNQFPPNTINVIREFERIQKKICRHKMSIMFNEICIYDYIDMCLYICIYAEYVNLSSFSLFALGYKNIFQHYRTIRF